MNLLWLFETLSTWWHELSGLVLLFLSWAKGNWKLIGIISVSSFVLSIVGCTVLITYLPSDYFTSTYQRRHIKNPILRFFVSLLKNIVGFLIVIVGVLMSVPGIPGQGLLTILVGLILSDFPGKRRLVNRIIRMHAVYSAANKIRIYFKRQPLALDEI